MAARVDRDLAARERLARSGRRAAFTLIEILVAVTVFLLLLGILFSVISQAGSAWQRTRSDADAYQSARFAFNLISRTLSQSRMNAYTDYDVPSQPTAYRRQSDLNFVISEPPGPDFGQGNAIFFQAPANRTLDPASLGGLPGLLNSVGYYVTYGKNPNLPAFLQSFDRNRFRLMQLLTPAEKMRAILTGSSSGAWYQDQLSTESTVIADNVICLIFWPRLSSEEDPEGDDLTSVFGNAYRYDSRYRASDSPQPVTANQQPPLVEVALVALDKAAAGRLPDSSAPPSEVADALSGLFTQANSSRFSADLAELEQRLNSRNLACRVFRTTVQLKESRWSK